MLIVFIFFPIVIIKKFHFLKNDDHSTMTINYNPDQIKCKSMDFQTLNC